jgi:hypothetical protein
LERNNIDQLHPFPLQLPRIPRHRPDFGLKKGEGHNTLTAKTPLHLIGAEGKGEDYLDVGDNKGGEVEEGKKRLMELHDGLIDRGEGRVEGSSGGERGG